MSTTPLLVLLVSSLLLACSSQSQSFLSLEDPNFNTALATKFWNLCMGSYCKTSRIANWDIGAVSDRLPGMIDITVVINSTGNACGYTAYYPAENEIIFVFRGTEVLSIKNWIDDLDFISTDYPDCSGCRVHEGFYKTYLNIRDQVLNSGRALYKKYPTARKLVTGHSLGGAIAVHAAVDVHKNFGPIDEFYTYGQPRVGNTAFAEYFNAMAPSGYFHSRITHNRDPVPHLPLVLMGFFHIDREVYYNSAGSYQICNIGEDSGCSNGHLDVNIVDHLNYMGLELTPFMIACNL